MGSDSSYQPHKLVVPVLYGARMSLMEVDQLVAQTFGSVDSRSAEIDFSFTHYYDAEMGTPITRVLYSVADLVDPAKLSALKIRSNEVEGETALPDGRRIINLDPGLLSLSRFILATTKPSGHRIPIGQGMHAEITLLFRHGSFQPLEWTYPDFRSPAYQQWLSGVRRVYHRQLKALDSGINWRL